MCGEKSRRFPGLTANAGSPPRVRGKESCYGEPTAACGITPACAGKSTTAAISRALKGDHPRVCGEKEPGKQGGIVAMGSPPRVRGKVTILCDGNYNPGITPACAGKRLCYFHVCLFVQDHPRVCGEKVLPASWRLPALGSPPRVRGKALAPAPTIDIIGITPACAGKSFLLLLQCFLLRDHPRVCGEKAHQSAPSFRIRGSPPRVRGKAFTKSFEEHGFGITPACAGKRKVIALPSLHAKDHPRVCGEKFV